MFAEVPQVVQDFDQALGVAVMQADRRLVKHVKRTHQPRAERGCQLNALRLAAGKRGREPIERQVFQSDLVQVAQPVVDLLQQLVGDAGFLPRQLQVREEFVASSTVIAEIWQMSLPPIFTWRASRRSRRPPHSEQTE